MKSFLVPILTLSLLASSCSEDTGEPNTASTPEVVEFIGGTIELTGRLAEAPGGALQLVASSPRLTTPLVQKCAFEGLEKTAAGTLLVPFSLGSHSGMMASRAIPREDMPAELSLKVSFSPDGLVEGIEREHDFETQVRVGDAAIKLRMEPQEAPRSRPTSRSTSRPVGIDD